VLSCVVIVMCCHVLCCLVLCVCCVVLSCLVKCCVVLSCPVLCLSCLDVLSLSLRVFREEGFHVSPLFLIRYVAHTSHFRALYRFCQIRLCSPMEMDAVNPTPLHPTTSREVRLLLIGWGSVGQAFGNMLVEKDSVLRHKYGLNIKVALS
jgi:hypothetical protein